MSGHDWLRLVIIVGAIGSVLYALILYSLEFASLRARLKRCPRHRR